MSRVVDRCRSVLRIRADRVPLLLQAGHSVLLHISGFLPYFWVAAPKDFTNADCQPLMEYLNVS